MTIFKTRRQIIGIYPTGRGFGFAVFEAKGRLAYAGLARLGTNSDDEFLARIERIVERYNPAIMVFEDTTHSARSERAMRRIELSAKLARLLDMRVLVLSRGEIRQVLNLPSGATNYEMAEMVAELLPELKQRLPDKPKIWQSKDERMALFAATALAVGSLQNESRCS